MSRYKVSPDGSNGYMQWFVVRDDGGGRWTRVGPSFDDPSDGYDERSAEERAEEMAALLNAETTEAARRERERVARMFDEEAARCPSQAYAYEYAEMAARVRAKGGA